LRIDGSPNFSIMYQKNSENKKIATLVPKNEAFHDYLDVNHLQDESKRLNYAYTSAREYLDAMAELHSTPFLKKEDILESSAHVENSLILVPGSSISLGTYYGEDVILTIGTSSCSLSWGNVPLGTAYVQKVNELIRKMIPDTDANGVPDLSKLTKEQVAILKRMESEQNDVIIRLGGVNEYEILHKIAEHFGSLIRFANGQIPNLSKESSQIFKLGLEKAGIDTTKPFYINGQKLEFSNEGVITYRS